MFLDDFGDVSHIPLLGTLVQASFCSGVWSRWFRLAFLSGLHGQNIGLELLKVLPHGCCKRGTAFLRLFFGILIAALAIDLQFGIDFLPLCYTPVSVNRRCIISAPEGMWQGLTNVWFYSADGCPIRNVKQSGS
jgi:hypothetical protein